MTDNGVILIIIIFIIIVIARLYAKKDGKWADSAVTLEKVKNHLDKYKLTKHMYKKFNEKPQPEVEWNKHLEESFKKSFLSVKRGNPRKKSEIDLAVGKTEFGIELKWASALKSTGGFDRAKGQLERYSKNQDYSNLMLVVAGTISDKHEIYLQDTEKMVKEIGITYYFMEIS